MGRGSLIQTRLITWKGMENNKNNISKIKYEHRTCIW
jgi:hypothetical protein